MSYCPECGTKLHESENFCPECGTEINVVSKESTESFAEEYYEEETPVWQRWIKKGVKVLLIFIGVFVSFVIIVDKYGTAKENIPTENFANTSNEIENDNVSESTSSMPDDYERQMEEQRNQEKERQSKIRSQIYPLESSFDRGFELLENECRIVASTLGDGWPPAPNTVESMENDLERMIDCYNQIYSIDPSYEKLGEMRSKINTAKKAIVITTTNINRYNAALR